MKKLLLLVISLSALAFSTSYADSPSLIINDITGVDTNIPMVMETGAVVLHGENGWHLEVYPSPVRRSTMMVNHKHSIVGMTIYLDDDRTHRTNIDAPSCNNITLNKTNEELLITGNFHYFKKHMTNRKQHNYVTNVHCQIIKTG